AAAASEAQGIDLEQERPLRFVTASLQVDYLRPTPQGVPLTLRGHIKDLGERRVTVEVSLFADNEEKVRGRVVAARMPERMKQ
ncbi:MAG: PaaI family thioesterase, partial [Desulfohalobiaceae bacterium]